jgi:RHS repeat-associated protein
MALTDWPGAIARISPDGSYVQNPWVILPGEFSAEGGDLYLDQTGRFQGDLIIATRSGDVWRVDSSGRPSLIAQLGTRLNGVVAVPEDAARFGPWAGRLLIGAGRRHGVFALDPQGDAEFFELGVDPQELLRAAHENFFGIDSSTNTLWVAPASEFSAMVGDILIAQHKPGILWRVKWDGDRFTLTEVARAGRWQQAIFSPAGLSGVVPAVSTVGLAITRHAPAITDARVEGSLQQLIGEEVALRGGTVITSDLLVPGTPSARVEGTARIGTLFEGAGSASPSGYAVTLGGSAMLARLVTRTDPVSIEVVDPPPLPAGTRDVTLTKPGQSPGAFSTLRNLTLTSNAGAVSVPPGTYGKFAAQSQSTFVLGVAGSAQPSVYNLQELSLSGKSRLQVVGPIVLTIAKDLAVSSQSAGGSEENPSWLQTKIAQGGASITGGSSLYGSIHAPSGAVAVEANSLLRGTAAADRLQLSGNATFQVTMQAGTAPTNQPPAVNAGADLTLTLPNSAALTGLVTDDGLPNNTLTIAWSKVSGPGTVTFANASQATTTASFSAAGVYVLRLAASDTQLSGSDDVTVAVSNPAPVNQPPSVNAGPDQSITLPNSATLTGTAGDDGLPNGTLTVTWSKVSGPGSVTFANPNQAATTASFGAQGVYVLRLTADDSQLTSSDEVTITVNPPASVFAVNAGQDQTISLPNGAALTGTVTGPTGPVTVGWSRVSGPQSVLFSNASATSTGAIFSTPGSYTLRLTASDGQSMASDDVVLTVNDDPVPPPPDPSTVAPPISKGVATTIGLATQFLYTGANPIQTGVAPGTIEPKRAAVLRGHVVGQGGAPLAKVKITIGNHPEYGQTYSRADGMFDIAVNGGGVLTLNYEKLGFLPVQRKNNVPWQDFVMLPDVVMMGYDPAVSFIDLSAAIPVQVAQGTAMTDGDGTRRSTLFFVQGTMATMKFANGSTQPLSQLHVRATEYTVGANGPKAMPGELPSTSAYTYAVEYSVDEAVAAGAATVTFSQPVIQYLENFLNFPVGTDVPAGSYDRTNSIWMPESSGRVVKILSVGGGQANLDLDGSGQAATQAQYDAMGITTAERQQLAALYAAGQSFWRVPVAHFTPLDYNYAGVPLNATASQGVCKGDGTGPCDHEVSGSIIECESQTLGERVDVVGTPFSLNYRSIRVPGRTAGYTITIPLSGATLPASLKRIELTINVAGRTFRQTFPNTPNQTTTFTWDGKDAYNRTVQFKQVATVNVGYVYDLVYYATQRFGDFGSGVSLQVSRPTSEATLLQIQRVPIGAFDARGIGLGGWTLSPHHAYDPNNQILYLGSGRQLQVNSLSNVITGFAGGGTPSDGLGDGLPAPQASLLPGGLVVAPDGTVYIADLGHNRVRKVAPNGIISTVAGTGVAGYNGDNIPATQAKLNGPNGVALAPDGSLYIADQFNQRIRKVSPGGVITTVAGTGTVGYTGDGGPATQAQLNFPEGPAVAPDGTLYFADSSNRAVRRVAPDGIISTVVLGGSSSSFVAPIWVAIGPDGLLYFSANSNTQGFVFRINLNRSLTVVAGGGSAATPNFGDGLQATQAYFGSAGVIAFAPNGTLYIIDGLQKRVRAVKADGVINSVAGNGIFGNSGDGGPALLAQFQDVNSLAVGPDGALYAADQARVRRISLPLPGFTANDLAIPSTDGSELYQFDSTGRHLRTVNTLTGANHYSFAYDSAGRLIQITDGDGNVTTVEHNANGDPSAIVGPFGQRTALAVNADGFLIQITDPADQSYQLSYTTAGLLTAFTNPRNQASTFQYDAGGRLSRDTDAATGFQSLSRTEQSTGHTSSLTTALNRTSSYQTLNPATGDERNFATDFAGLTTRSTRGADGTIQTTYPDGTVDTVTRLGDPRWKMQAPLPATTTSKTPAGLTFTTTFARTVTLSDPNNLLSLTAQNDTFKINGRTYTTNYAGATRTFTATTPVGRLSTATIDVQGRVTQSQFANLNASAFTYDSRGRLSTTVFGAGPQARNYSLSYNANGYLASVTDPLSRTTGFLYDAAGRVTQKSLPDGRVIGFAYDAMGNLTSVTPPGRPAHNFVYTAVDQISSYAAPNVGVGNQTTYTYNLDRQLTSITRPDSQTLTFAYDSGARLSTLTIPGGAYTFSYNATTGNLSSITAPGGGTVSYIYDGSLLKQTTWAGTVAGSVSRVFDNNFRVTSQSVNGANPINLTYDNDSLLTGAGSLTLTRNAQTGFISGTTLGSVTDSRNYTGFGEVSSYAASFNATGIYSTSYTYDKLSRITQKVESIGGGTDTYDYTYDTAGRLTQVQKNSAVVATYTYDSNGNRLSYTGAGPAINGTYDNQDRLTQYGTATYAYTASGELTTKTVGAQVTSYQYDVIGNLKNVTLPNGTQIDYLIDGQNRRIGKKVNGTLAQGFLYQDALNPVAELDGSNNVVSRFVYASRANVPDYLIRGGVTYRIVSDRLGSPRLVVDVATGNVAQRIDYDEFGVVIADTNPGFQPFGFAGGLYDKDTGLVRFGARDYDAPTGRWTAKDPIQFTGGDTNLYGYVMNDPVNFLDLNGLFLIPLYDDIRAIGLPLHPDAKIPFPETFDDFVKHYDDLKEQYGRIDDDDFDPCIKKLLDDYTKYRDKLEEIYTKGIGSLSNGALEQLLRQHKLMYTQTEKKFDQLIENKYKQFDKMADELIRKGGT